MEKISIHYQLNCVKATLNGDEIFYLSAFGKEGDPSRTTAENEWSMLLYFVQQYMYSMCNLYKDIFFNAK